MSERFVYIWEFHVAPGLEYEFRRYYGPQGIWADLFRQHPGYLETVLLQDQGIPGRYLTVDHWQCEEACHAFMAEFARQYEILDRQCEGLSLKEGRLGSYREIVK